MNTRGEKCCRGVRFENAMRKRREMLSFPEQLPDKVKGVACEPVSHQWTRRDTALVASIWAITAVALALLSIAAHVSAEFPGDEGLAVLIQKISFPPLVRIIEFSSDANWPAPAAYTALAIILVLLV